MKKNKLLMPIATITSLGAIAPVIALTSCGPKGGDTSHIVEPTAEEKAKTPDEGLLSADYTFTLNGDYSSYAPSNFQITVTEITNDNSIDVEPTSLSNNKLTCTATWTYEPSADTTCTFNIKIRSARDQWEQTINGLSLKYTHPANPMTITYDTETKSYSGDTISFTCSESDVIWSTTDTNVAYFTNVNTGTVTIKQPGKFSVIAKKKNSTKKGQTPQITANTVLNLDTTTDPNEVILKGFVSAVEISQEVWQKRIYAEFGHTLTIPANVTIVDDYAFGKTATTLLPDSITALDLSKATNLKSLGRYAFANSKIAGEITIPDTVTQLSVGLFYNDPITGINFPNNATIKTIPANCCTECASLQYATIPSNYQYIGASAFYDCSTITNIDLPTSLKEIGEYAFYQTHITNLVIPGTVEIIGKYAFGNLNSGAGGVGTVDLSAFTDATKLPTIGEKAFQENGTSQSAKFVIYNDSLHAAWQTLLDTNAGVTWGKSNWNIEIGVESLLDIRTGLHGFKTGVTDDQIIAKAGDTLVIPNTVSQIYSNAFNKDQSKTIPDTITKLRFQKGNICTSILTDSFTSSKINDIVLPSSINSGGLNSNCFRKMNITSISIDSANSNYTSRNLAGSAEINGLIKINSSVPNTLSFGTETTDLSSFTGLTKFDSYCYSGRTGLTSVKIPSTVTTLGDYIFENCTSLATIDLSGFTTVPSATWTNLNAFLNIGSTASTKTIKVASGTTSAWQTLFNTIWASYLAEGWTISEA